MHYERAHRKLVVFFCALGLLPATTAHADTVTELKVKAAFLYNFTKFIKWPPKTFASATDPLTICTSGEQPFSGILEETLNGKKVDDHPLVERQIKADADVKGCQVWFIPEEELPRRSNLLAAPKSASVLLVSEAQRGKTERPDAIMITFVLDSNRVRFRINNTAAERAGLNISARLLSLAVSVE
ncbi:MAG TPA: YfiR family protein [Bryobacteraceae bacterium]|jgi:hypothetical protein|nr:YfiR family protein [Bryobacteraceae bacterium]